MNEHSPNEPSQEPAPQVPPKHTLQPASEPELHSISTDRTVDTGSNAAASPAAAFGSDALPRSDRYRKLQKIGEGGYGAVWLVEDLELGRQVALKEPLSSRLRTRESVETFLREARMVASLDHPHIVPVYDVGRTEAGSCYVVSKLIDGQDLASYIEQRKPSFDEIAQWIAQVAEALQHTHNRGLVHRDIKPANILIDRTEHPFVTDFGLALRDEEFGQDHRLAGTPSYMSPEQVRSEGHLIDGRSDIFSLGVVLYELLTGVKPFRGMTAPEVFEQIRLAEPKPLRQRNPAIPKELERICLKALAKRVADRYRCASDMADELRNWSQVADADLAATALKVVPKGLRSFDAGDSSFFLTLLPGPRDREGLPESLRFWKTRIEETDLEQSFRIGLVYGPSGCGKSSLLKAGLLPRLADHVLRVFVEATPDQTEQQLLKGLRRACGDVPREATLTETLMTIRKGQGLPAGRKLVIVIDQFEQWLHTHGAEVESELAVALRQCDGERLQTILLVRDDFWMPVSRFMKELDTPMVENQNCLAVDLFDPLHARKVLVEFGKAYGRLPEGDGALSEEQEAFLSQAVSELVEEGKVISVRLALFADMMKARDWHPESLAMVGGIAGVGTTFLEETFSSRTAPPRHRLHQEAARLILRALLPGSGTDIKGHSRSAAELQVDCGYQHRSQEFTELLRILDREVRLITPALREESSSEPTAQAGIQADEAGNQVDEEVGREQAKPAYQLTHDYLVPSLRDWLTRKQRATRRGRAELRLEERAAAWSVKQENRQLPSVVEYVRIASLTERSNWTASQRRMMAQATRLHAVRIAGTLLLLAVLATTGLLVRRNIQRQQEATRAQGLVDSLVSAEPNQLSSIIRELKQTPELATRYLSPLLTVDAQTAEEKRALLHARLASVTADGNLVEPLLEELLTGKVTYVLPIRQQLKPSAAELLAELQQILRDEKADPQRRFRAAMALADYVPAADQEFWTDSDATFIVQQLVRENSEFQPLVREALRPIQGKLLEALETIFVSTSAREGERLSAANAFADYASQDVRLLARLLIDSTPEQYQVLYPLVAAAKSAETIAQLETVIGELPPEELGSVARVPFGQRRANAAATLLRLGEREKVVPVFKMTDDPEAMTQFIFRCRPRGVGIDSLLELFDLVSAAPRDRYPLNSRYALLLSLGEFALDDVPEARREALLAKLADWYANDPSSGVHGASGWLLRHWGQTDVAKKVDQTPVPYSRDREWFTLAITVTPTSPPSEPLPTQTFYYTFIVFREGEYTIGSVSDEPERAKDENEETRHAVKLSRPFALLDREITLEELIAFSPQHDRFMQQAQAQPSDAGYQSNWYDSVRFCRWLGEQFRLPESDQAYADPASLDRDQYPRETSEVANSAPKNWPLDMSRRGFRLPTEAEWEIAARSGARTIFGCGSDASLLNRFGWFVENSGKRVHRPKERIPSVRGLWDLHGNVFEWTHDWFTDYASAPPTDPTGPSKGSNRVFRGGGCLRIAAFCRSSDRNARGPTYGGNDLGFRLALSPVEPPAAGK